MVNIYGQCCLAVMLIFVTNQNLCQAMSVPPYNKRGTEKSDVGTEKSALESPRLSLLGESLLHNQFLSASKEEMQNTEREQDFVEHEVTDNTFGTEKPHIRQKRRYVICDVKHPSIFEILEFFRTRKLCGMKTGHFRFGMGK